MNINKVGTFYLKYNVQLHKSRHDHWKRYS